MCMLEMRNRVKMVNGWKKIRVLVGIDFGMLVGFVMMLLLHIEL